MPTGVLNNFASHGVVRHSSALKWVGWLFFLFALFPAVSVVPLPILTDTQPNALLMAVLVFLVGRRVPLPLVVWTLLILLIGAIALLVVSGASIDGVRSLVGYLTVFVTAVATLILAESNIRLPEKMLDYSVYIWAFIGIVQRVFSHSFMTFMVTASRTNEARGVASLSNEPSLYATTMIFYIIFYFVRGRERSFPVLLCILQIVMLSQSALGILFVLMMIFLYALLRLSAPTAIITVLALGAALFALVMYGDNYLAGTRIGSLLTLLRDSPWLILQADESVSERVASIFYSIKGTVDNAFLPHGFNGWKEYSFAQDAIYKGIMSSDPKVNRIMSGYGSALFEMGWVGLTIPALVTIGIVKMLWHKSRARAASLLLAVHLLLLTPVPLSFPLLGMLIGETFACSPARVTLAREALQLSAV